ncbi:MAG: sensor histidine kinase [Deltaproteobacteria bacterium]
MELRDKSKEELIRDLEKVNDELDRLKSMIGGLLDLSKFDAGKAWLSKENSDIIALARGVVNAFRPQAAAKNLELKEKFCAEQLTVYLDKDSITRLFTNLIGNAVKFTGKGYVEISITDKNDCVECGISDTGMGIAEEDLPKVFGKFQQFGRREGPGVETGTGLGLSICRSIVEMHHGKIAVESALNFGSKFTFTLPKYTERQIRRERVTEALKEAIRQSEPLCMLLFDIEQPPILTKGVDDEMLHSVTDKLENLLKLNLRRKFDLVVKDHCLILALLNLVKKDEISPVAERVKQNIIDFVSKEGLKNRINISYKLICYPEDGDSEEKILAEFEDTGII